MIKGESENKKEWICKIGLPQCGIDNAKMMSKPYRYMEDGTPVYLDRLCHEHINGEKVVSKYNYQKNCLQDVGVRTGKVYYDEQEVERKRFDEWNERAKQNAIERSYGAYMKYVPEIKKSVMCEVSTGKFIAKLGREEVDNKWVYRKYYLDIDAVKPLNPNPILPYTCQPPTICL